MDNSEAQARVGKRIAEARNRLGVSQSELARQLGNTPPTISRWESGDVAMTVPQLYAVAHALGCAVETLVVSIDDQSALLGTVQALPKEDQNFISEMAAFLHGRRRGQAPQRKSLALMTA